MDDQSPGVNPDDAKGAPRPTGPPAPRAAIDPDLYQRLRAIAADYLARERTGHTLQQTALVNAGRVVNDIARAVSSLRHTSLRRE